MKLYINLKFKDYTGQIKSAEITLHIESSLRTIRVIFHLNMQICRGAIKK